MNAKQVRAARLLALGITQVAVAKRVGCNAGTIRSWIAGTLGFNEAVERFRAGTEDAEATSTLYDLLDSNNDRIRFEAARELRRTPTGATAPTQDEDADLLDPAAWA